MTLIVHCRPGKVSGKLDGSCCSAALTEPHIRNVFAYMECSSGECERHAPRVQEIILELMPEHLLGTVLHMTYKWT